jgi:hypothetical protein
MSVHSNETTRRYSQEGSNLHSCSRENLKSHKIQSVTALRRLIIRISLIRSFIIKRILCAWLLIRNIANKIEHGNENATKGHSVGQSASETIGPTRVTSSVPDVGYMTHFC